jgi:hypothetical protein
VIISGITETISQNTARILKEFIKNGGKIYIDGEAPTLVDAREADLSWLKSNMTFDELKGEQEVEISADGASLSCIRAQTRKTENGRIIFVTNFTKNRFEGVEITVKNCKNLVKTDILSLAPQKLCGECKGNDFRALVSLDSSESFGLIESDDIAA